MTDLRVNNINIASQYSVNNAGQVAQTAESQNSVFETAKAETKQENKQDANLTNMIKTWFALTDEEWAQKTQDEKAALAKIYIEDAVAAKRRADKSSTLTVERQYEIYLERNTTEEEREILTLLTLHFSDDERQYNLASMSVKNAKNPELRNAAERSLAGNYHKATKNNQLRFVNDIVSDYAEENVEIAAENASKTDIENQEQIVKSFLNTNNEKINTIITAQINQFGIDNEGKINEAIKNACIKEINAAKSEIKTKAETKEVANETKTVILNTTSNEEIEEVEEVKEEVKEAVEEEIKEVAKSEITITEEKIETINNLLKENNQASIKTSIKEMTAQEQLTLLEENPDISIINAMLATNPSFIVRCKIEKILKSMDVKKLDSDIIANADEETQIEKIQQAASQNRLSTINRFCLTLKAKRVYDQIA